jgi:hypothetical protein
MFFVHEGRIARFLGPLLRARYDLSRSSWMAKAGNTTDLMLALGRYDAFLAKRHVETFGGDPGAVLRAVMEARENQLAAHIGALYYGGWWPRFADDMDVLPIVPQPVLQTG